MNPMTNIKNLQKLNERELELGIIGKKSWHDEYKGSAWIFVGGLPYDLSEGDVICVFSQYGEIVNVNLVRDSKTGKSKGYAFICYQDQRSTVLSVDNLNGIKILSRTIRVDHVKDYKMPKERGDEDEVTIKLRQDGCAPRIESSPEKEVDKAEDKEQMKKIKKELKKKMKKEKKKKKKKKTSSSEDDNSSSEADDKGDKPTRHSIVPKIEIKEEKEDNSYDKALKQRSSKTMRHDDSTDEDDDDESEKDDDSGSERRRKKKRSKDSDHDSIQNGEREERWSGGERYRRRDNSDDRGRGGNKEWNPNDREERWKGGDGVDTWKKRGRGGDGQNGDWRNKEERSRRDEYSFGRERGERERVYQDNRDQERYYGGGERNQDGNERRWREGGGRDYEGQGQRRDKFYRNGDGKRGKSGGSRERNRTPTKRYDRSRSRER